MGIDLLGKVGGLKPSWRFHIL